MYWYWYPLQTNNCCKPGYAAFDPERAKRRFIEKRNGIRRVESLRWFAGNTHQSLYWATPGGAPKNVFAATRRPDDPSPANLCHAEKKLSKTTRRPDDLTLFDVNQGLARRRVGSRATSGPPIGSQPVQMRLQAHLNSAKTPTTSTPGRSL